VAVTRKKRTGKQAIVRDLTVIAIVAAASLVVAINMDHIYFAAVFAGQAAAAVVLARRIGKAPD
jgi:hypothetical protein